MEIPKFSTRQEIVNYSLNGTDPQIILMVRHRIEKDGSNLNVSEVNTFIRNECKDLQKGYEAWIHKLKKAS